MRVIALCGLLAALVGCAPNPDMPMYQQTANAEGVDLQNSSRVKVTRVGVFKDDLAYNSRRGVYLIRDEQTGQEFIGVSGIGISETGSHYQSTGKSGYMHADER